MSTINPNSLIDLLTASKANYKVYTNYVSTNKETGEVYKPANFIEIKQLSSFEYPYTAEQVKAFMGDNKDYKQNGKSYHVNDVVISRPFEDKQTGIVCQLIKFLSSEQTPVTNLFAKQISETVTAKPEVATVQATELADVPF